MKKQYVFMVAAILATGAASAQTSKFQGPFLQLGIGYESVSPTHDSSTLSVNGRNIPVGTSSNSTDNFAGVISAGYYQHIAKGFLLGVGVDYAPIAGSSGTMSVTTESALPGQNYITNDYNYQKKNSYNIFLSPAVAVGENGMAYAKVGYTGAEVSNYNTLTYNFTGYSLGLGYKQIFSDGWYGFIEGNYASYGEQTESATNPVSIGRTLTASGTNGLDTYNILVGVGYKF